ncbi:hypothetical protein TH66_07745 [Carbonactinospora thermoautotrophica]|uniref:VOC domain-containing protein n=1 Tax=Carbonactinospora thermoautotrophica TaxID=1469144 RepID=A0A132N346_9ACTN|nr:VOC family protein [Carbonactinospora thermoautotrophica]KWX04568.1 hypothetical protein TH66_07745 [Carbonactinospora thermoautotrophica]KWX08339.1 hypothetical protein TR74_15445 [Carbonactinospora thermoautotrophica]
MSEVTERYAPGVPAWVDLSAQDREAAQRFYGELFGWDFEVGPPEVGYYTQCTVRGLPVAGIYQTPSGEDGPPVAWITYLATDDVDATVARAREAGGQVLMGPMDVLEEGRIALLADPTGAVVGLWQARRHIGARVVNEPVSPCWSELATRDAARAREFYRALFDYELHDMSGFDYTTLRVAGRDVAGVWGATDVLPPDVPAHWAVYFAVPDADEVAATVTKLGGRVLREPVDSPYGRFATVQDPQGAVFGVLRLPE